jgi:hypothetical protein
VSIARHVAVCCAVLAGCASPQRAERNVEDMQPAAIAAAEDRARTDLDCSALSSKVLSSEHSRVRDAYSLQRIEYRIEVQGCNRRTVFSVACAPKSPCSALSESGLVERVK